MPARPRQPGPLASPPAPASAPTFPPSWNRRRRGASTPRPRVKIRLHQRRFRELVLPVYQVRCAVCRLKRGELLDAAHILPDRDERGRPEIANGLSLCKIHHAAFDAHILGVAPDYVVHIRRDVLEEHDGPMLTHGLKEMDGQRILVPRAASLKPRKEYLEERYGRFRAA